MFQVQVEQDKVELNQHAISLDFHTVKVKQQ
jgi:hypothetical protein